ncbi:thiamine-phosphate pyrophosphorylase [Anseongella ginsenosidimutans]|uniref:Thiamine-phosphate pyrophosphorylase n=1 Tax=Anseongella ginsenosidimutans TaxID=496056 RepID=A0A4R3KR01_9SPHI|nr:thiamine phosphate synthase [Anseongella ginsenosidimutans]QEC53746.1 thiamine phosphate synthase [Anseongella ginsenosidimutans]TCS85998.1 thiamine-phosphate pyrophosphorylase [Anseongella ginsenosidimutans]
MQRRRTYGKRKAGNFRLLVITPALPVLGEQAIVRDLFGAGLSGLHLRKPGLDVKGIKAWLRYFTKAERSKIRVHSGDASLLEMGIAGLHLPFHALDKFICAGGGITASIHSWQEYAELERTIEYAFISPVYKSLSKPGYAENKNTWNLPAVPHVPVIALGGIRSRNIAKVIQAGFSGAGLLGTVWQQPERAVKVFNAVKDQVMSWIDEG